MATFIEVRKQRLSTLLATMFFLVLPNISHAVSKFANCDGCSSFQEEAAAAAETQSGRVYIMDATNDTINAFDAYYYPIFNPPQTVAVSTATPSHIGNYFNTVVAQLHSGQSVGVPIPASVVDSAHSLVGNNQNQVAVSNYLLGVFFEAPEIAGIPDDELTDLRDELLAGKPVMVEFADLSTAILALVDFAVGAAEFNLSDDSLTDAQDNAIPDSAGDVVPGLSGSFSSGGLGGLGLRDDFVNTLTLLGVATSGDGASGGGSSCVTFSCASTSSGMECILSMSSSGC